MKNYASVTRWTKAHPQTGWYIAVVVTVNFAMHVVQGVL